MRKPLRVTLWSWQPPWVRRCAARQLTLGRFLDLAEVVNAKLMKMALMLDRQPTQLEILASMREAEIFAMADACFPDEPAGFFVPFLTRRNVLKVLCALEATNDVPGLLGLMKVGPYKRKVGSVDGDVERVCRQYQGVTPEQVHAWPMDVFLRTIRGLEDADKQYDPTSDESAQPASAAAIAGMGTEVKVTVH